MRCAVCKHGETKSGLVSIMLEREGTTLVFKEVPAEICENCGEEYFSAETNKRILELANDAKEKGVELELLRYAA